MKIVLVNNINSNTITINENNLSLLFVDNIAKQVGITKTATSFTELIIDSEISIEKLSLEKVYVQP